MSPQLQIPAIPSLLLLFGIFFSLHMKVRAFEPHFWTKKIVINSRTRSLEDTISTKRIAFLQFPAQRSNGKISISSSSDGGDSDTLPRRPPPRRTLKKRKNKRRERMDELFRKAKGVVGSDGTSSFGEDDEIETRPMRRADAVQAGLDYWIDDRDLEKERQRKIAIRNRKSMEGEISKEKLRSEVVAPYKQNWIGIFSVFIVIISAIATKFPEVMQIPIIPIPDL